MLNLVDSAGDLARRVDRGRRRDRAPRLHRRLGDRDPRPAAAPAHRRGCPTSRCILSRAGHPRAGRRHPPRRARPRPGPAAVRHHAAVIAGRPARAADGRRPGRPPARRGWTGPLDPEDFDGQPVISYHPDQSRYFHELTVRFLANAHPRIEQRVQQILTADPAGRRRPRASRSCRRVRRHLGVAGRGLRTARRHVGGVTRDATRSARSSCTRSGPAAALTDPACAESSTSCSRSPIHLDDASAEHRQMQNRCLDRHRSSVPSVGAALAPRRRTPRDRLQPDRPRRPAQDRTALLPGHALPPRPVASTRRATASTSPGSPSTRSPASSPRAGTGEGFSLTAEETDRVVRVRGRRRWPAPCRCSRPPPAAPPTPSRRPRPPRPPAPTACCSCRPTSPRPVRPAWSSTSRAVCRGHRPRCRRLQPRQRRAPRRGRRDARRPQPDADRLQGRRRQHRADDPHLRPGRATG